MRRTKVPPSVFLSVPFVNLLHLPRYVVPITSPEQLIPRFDTSSSTSPFSHVRVLLPVTTRVITHVGMSGLIFWAFFTGSGIETNFVKNYKSIRKAYILDVVFLNIYLLYYFEEKKSFQKEKFERICVYFLIPNIIIFTLKLGLYL